MTKNVKKWNFLLTRGIHSDILNFAVREATAKTSIRSRFEMKRSNNCKKD